MTSPARPRALRLAVALVVAGVAALVGASPAHADAYRYWGYYQLTDGAWTFAQKGPSETKPADGSVEGWRFAVADESSTRTPRVVPTFDQLCSATATAAGSKRVGVVVDYGRAADGPDGSAEPPAPHAQCVSVAADATGADVLAATELPLRLSKGLTCGIDGWPATGCGDPVAPVPAAAASPDTSITLPAASPSATASAADQAADDDGGLPTAAWIGLGAVVLVLVVLGLLAFRRRGELQG